MYVHMACIIYLQAQDFGTNLNTVIWCLSLVNYLKFLTILIFFNYNEELDIL